MRDFLLVWLAQLVSLMGSHLTGFGLGVWFYQRTGSVTVYGTLALASVLPQLLATPLAGVVADRWDRRLALIVGHAGGGLCSLVIVALARADKLSLATTLPPVALSSAFHALLVPTFSASITLLVPTAKLGQANGLVQLGAALSQIIAPAAAGALLGRIGLGGILAMDVGTFLFAVAVLAGVRIPRPPASEAGRGARGSMWREAAYGWRCLRERPALIGLTAFLGVVNFNLGMVQLLVTPLVLGFASAQVLGTVLTTAGLGMLAGGGVMVLWGGPERRIRGMLALVLLQGLLMFLGGARAEVVPVAAAAFGILFAVPLLVGASQTLWQRKVPADVQGRVFAIKTTVSGAAMPLAFLIGGPLADRVFEPWMRRDGALAPLLGGFIGVGPGRGVALLFFLLGLLMVLAVLVGSLHPRFRRLEDELPDCVAAPSRPSDEPRAAAPVSAARNE